MSKTIMVLAPHPDDEALMCAGVIYRAVHNGDRVVVLLATLGDYGGIDIGRDRMDESIRAMKLLGVPEDNMLFLNYGDDGGMDEYPPQQYTDSMLYKLYHASDENQVFTSHAGASETYRGSLLSFHKRCYGTEGAYTRKNFLCDLQRALTEVMPKEIYTTSRYDVHGDHAYLCHFTVEAIRNLRSEIPEFTPKLYEAIVHAPCGDSNWPKRNSSGQGITELNCPKDLEEKTSLRWNERISIAVPESMRRFPLSNNLKQTVISQYVSQYAEHREYLSSYVKRDEVFWRSDV
jgi:LmbE family N-acetylglucosaminyl deacetylase